MADVDVFLNEEWPALGDSEALEKQLEQCTVTKLTHAFVTSTKLNSMKRFSNQRSLCTSRPGVSQRHPHHPAQRQRHQRGGPLPQEGGRAAFCRLHPEAAGRAQRPVGKCLQAGARTKNILWRRKFYAGWTLRSWDIRF